MANPVPYLDKEDNVWHILYPVADAYTLAAAVKITNTSLVFIKSHLSELTGPGSTTKHPVSHVKLLEHMEARKKAEKRKKYLDAVKDRLYELVPEEILNAKKR